MAKEDDFYDDIEDWEDDDEFEEWMRQEEERTPSGRGCAPAAGRGILFFAALALLFRWLEHIN